MYEPHALALLIPPMSDEEKTKLEEDIAAHGLRDAITLYEGKVLDGVHRQAACVKVGVKPRYVEFKGDDAHALVASRNLHRRHLSKGQLAIVGANLLPYFEEDAYKRIREGAARGGSQKPWAKWPEPSEATIRSRATQDAARVVGASDRHVRRAKRVLDADPELAAEVERGKLSLGTAERRLRPETPKPASAAPPAPPPPTPQPQRRPKTWNGTSTTKREQQLRDANAAKTYGKHLGLLIQLNRLCAGLSTYSNVVLDLAADDVTTPHVLTLLDDLITTSEWVDRTIASLYGWLTHADIHARIAKLRDTTGRTPEETDTALAIADRLERKLDARLAAGA